MARAPVEVRAFRRKLAAAALDLWRADRGGQRGIETRQRARLGALLGFAREHSRLYARLHRHLPGDRIDLRQWPVVTKSALMEAFDDWVTDPAARLADVNDFMAQSSPGQLYRGRYGVWKTSGVSGHRAIYLQDMDTLAVYAALMLRRGLSVWIRPARLWPFLRHGGREAVVTSALRHTSSVVVKELARLGHPIVARRSHSFSVLTPLPDLVHALNQFQPATVVAYPTTMIVLSEEQTAGRLNIRPALIVTSGEGLDLPSRARMETVFRCPVRDMYAAAEFMGIAFDCGHGRLHVNSDWVILEPVDETYQPVPPGHPSHTVLLTNLANRIQPFIRYDLGDSVTLSAAPCRCGSPLPAISVEGRTDDILRPVASNGARLALQPRALSTFIQNIPGVARFQAIQTGPAEVTIRLEAVPGADESDVWDRLVADLRAFLGAQGLSSVSIHRSPDRPHRDPATGKYRKVWIDAGAGVTR